MKIRGIIEISVDDGKWEKLNNGNPIDLTDTGSAFHVHGFGVSIKGVVLEK